MVLGSTLPSLPVSMGGVRAFIVGLRVGDYCGAIDGLSYAVRKANWIGWGGY